MARLTWLALCAAVALVLGPRGHGAPPADAARILVVIAMPAPSHQIIFTALTRALAERGHHITLVAPASKTDKLVPTHNHEFVSVLNDTVLQQKQNSIKKFMTGEKESFLKFMVDFIQWGPLLVRSTLLHPNFKAVVDKPGQKYDLVITEAFFLQEAMVGLGHKFNVPVIALNPFGTSPQVDDIMGNPVNPAWVPNAFFGISDRKTFQQRVVSTFASSTMRLLYWYYQLPLQQELVSEFFPDAPPLVDMLLSRLALSLLNSHPSLGYPVPMSPAAVEVGGLQIPDQPKPLPEDLKKLMDSAKDGVVYFSMGSNLQMEYLAEEKMYAIFNSLGSLKERVLLKWDGPLPKEGVSKNIHIIKWAPQADLLAHPNLKLFVTHGGLLSTQESVYNGVPLVGIPVFADQDYNMGLASAKGFCEKVSFKDLSEEKLTAALNKVLRDPSYKEAASRLSRLFRAKPMRPIDLAVFWVEHVMQNGGEHLRPSSVHLPMYQLLLLDVIVALLAPLLLLFLLLRFLCRCCRGNKRPTVHDKKKKN